MSETCNDTCTVAHPACTHPLPNTTTHNHRFKPGGVSPVYYLSASGTIPHIPAERDSKITICNTNETHTFKHVCADTLCIISHCTPYTIKPVCYIVHVHRYTIYFTHHSGDFTLQGKQKSLILSTCHIHNLASHISHCCAALTYALTFHT